MAVDAVEGRIPLHRLAHAGNSSNDKCVEAAPNFAFPAGHGRDVSLHGGVTVSLRNLRIAACEQRWLGGSIDSVAVLPHDPVNRAVLLCEQFRLPTVAHGPGWLLEIPAGILETGEDVEACARREMIEETGYSVYALDPIATVYLSPGGSSERIHIFRGGIALRADAADTAGIESEGEDIHAPRSPPAEKNIGRISRRFAHFSQYLRGAFIQCKDLKTLTISTPSLRLGEKPSVQTLTEIGRI